MTFTRSVNIPHLLLEFLLEVREVSAHHPPSLPTFYIVRMCGSLRAQFGHFAYAT